MLQRDGCVCECACLCGVHAWKQRHFFPFYYAPFKLDFQMRFLSSLLWIVDCENENWCTAMFADNHCHVCWVWPPICCYFIVIRGKITRSQKVTEYILKLKDLHKWPCCTSTTTHTLWCGSLKFSKWTFILLRCKLTFYRFGCSTHQTCIFDCTSLALPLLRWATWAESWELNHI